MNTENFTAKVSVLFVCMGNYCRSPAAEAFAKYLVKKKGISHLFHIESAGTHNYHEGQTPDPRMQKEAEGRGYILSDIKGRSFQSQDLKKFQYILAMDKRNLDDLATITRQASAKRAELILKYTSLPMTEVPDPYYSNRVGFSNSLDLIEAGVSAFIKFATEK